MAWEPRPSSPTAARSRRSATCGRSSPAGSSGASCSASRASGPHAHALSRSEDRADKNPVLRDRLTFLWIESEVNRLTNLRAAQNRQKGTPGPEGSVGKLAFAETNKRVYDFCIDLLGPT